MQKIVYKGIFNGPGSTLMNQDTLDLEKKPSQPILRLGIWKPPAVSLGRAQLPTGKFAKERITRRGLQVIVRPTGGLFILHHPGTITIHIIWPRDTELYEKPVPVIGLRLAKLISEALKELGVNADTRDMIPSREKMTRYETDICLAYKGAADIIYNGVKVGAGALRKTSKGLLFQGYLILDRPWYDLWAWIDQYPDANELRKIFGGLSTNIPLEDLAVALLDGLQRLLEFS